MSISKQVSDYLHVASVSDPVFHPNGDRLSYITDDETGIPQLWSYDFNTGLKQQVLKTEDRVMFVTYIPGSAKRVIGMDARGNERKQLYLIAEEESVHRLTPVDDAIYKYGGPSADGRYIAWASNERHKAYYDLYIANIENGDIRKIFEGNSNYSIMSWHPDGRRLLVQEHFTNLYSRLGLLHIESGHIDWFTPEAESTSYNRPIFSKDGEALYILSNRQREFKAVAMIDMQTYALQWLCRHEWDVENLVMNEAGTQLAYTTNEAGIYRGWLYDLKTQTYEDWQVGIGTIAELTFNHTGEKLGFIFNGPASPADIWILETATLNITRLHCTSTSAAFESRLIEPSIYQIRSFDELEVPSFLYKPRHLKEPAPVAFWVHGGPESQTKAEYHPVIQCLVNLGYIVCAPNVRGSRGYGRTYIHLDDVRRRMDSVQDLVEIAAALKKEPEVNADRVAVMGRSYGGFMVLAAVTHYPDVFAIGIDLVGISSFRTFLENTGPWRRKLRESEYGTIEEDGAFFDAIDPIHYTEHVTAPLLVSHGANDPRVPIAETEQMIDELKARDHPVEYVRFEDEGHGIVKLQNKIEAYTKMAEFLDVHL
ncbi:alpha/beta hydrolase family protein [Natribacillus halophilus]|uniref:Dipeptidyl aminopeptidase/acylaminoacyl peptidase n=1 Tax=Natribacillus halophilus TaxID=549003 RepID=A0A1G8SAN9_9BACI|nr:S9 family peptidase [Natribacillus halophilus]SDJ26288.1 Dipeptidyl aminopeptidase/acylaminoacyl peptidase [Natribacillus halophilus]